MVNEKLEPFGGDPHRLFQAIRNNIGEQARFDPLGRALWISRLADAVIQEWINGLTDERRRAVLGAREAILSEAEEEYQKSGLILGRLLRIRTGPIPFEGQTPPLVADAVEAKWHADRWLYLYNSVGMADGDADEVVRLTWTMSNCIAERETALRSMLERLDGREARVSTIRKGGADQAKRDEAICRAVDGIIDASERKMSVAEAIRVVLKRAKKERSQYWQFYKADDKLLKERGARRAYDRAKDRETQP